MVAQFIINFRNSHATMGRGQIFLNSRNNKSFSKTKKLQASDDN